MSRFSKVSSIFGRDAFATMRYVTLLNVSVGRNRYVVAAKFLVFFDIISNMWLVHHLGLRRLRLIKMQQKRTSLPCCK